MSARVEAALRDGARRLVGRGARAADGGLTAEEWALLCARAEPLHLLPLLADSGAPVAVRQLLADARRRRQARTAVLLRDLATATAALAQAGVDVIVLKGAALALIVYDSPARRYFDDLDLLVGADSAESAHQTLVAAGYRPHPNQPLPDWHHRPPLVHPATGTTIELHTDVVRRYRPGWPVDELRQRAVPVPGTAARAPAAPDALVLTALHARHHLFERLTFLTDAALLAARIDDWPALWATAAAAGGQRALAHLLAQAYALGLLDGAPHAGGVGFGRIAARLLARRDPLAPLPPALRSGALPRLAELLLLDSPTDSARLAWRLVYPSQPFIAAGGRSRGRRLAARAALALRQAWSARRAAG